ncbi:MAG: histidine kinase [Mucilaginibacter sp.]|nr:histidine kinase [Mucilaginibacter sp.]
MIRGSLYQSLYFSPSRIKTKALLLFIIACFFSFMGYGQTLPLVNYTIQNGLPEAMVYAIYIDNAGYLWVGTQGGVASFDGRQFHVYDSQFGLPDNHVTAITGTNDGRIFFGHHSGALSYCSNNAITNFRHHDYVNDKFINSMVWQNHSLYLATQGNGLFCITFLNKGYSIKHFTTKQHLLSDTLNQLVVKNSNEIWMATTKGLSVFNTQTNVPVTATFPAELSQKITSVYQQANGVLWCGTASGAIYFEPGNPQIPVKKITIAHGLLDEHINMIKGDRQGNIWLATNKGVAKINGSVVRCFTKSNGLLSELVYDIAADREHNIWIGQYDGLSCYKNLPFELYTVQDGLVYNEVYSIMEDSKNNYWVGTAGGITVFNPKITLTNKVKNFTVKDGLPDNLIYKTFEDSRKNIWIACANKGAACYLPDKKKFLVFSGSNGLAGKEVVSINEDKKGRIWLATLDSGVAVYNYDKKQMQSYKSGKGFVSNSVWTIYRDAHGQLWFGSQDKGLIYLDTLTDQFVIAPGQEKLPNHRFGSISSDSKGNIWIASIGAGIFKYDGKSFKQYGIREGIKSNNPYFIFCDRDDHIWLGTNVGIDLFNPITLTTRNFVKNDGFMGIETNQNAVYQARNNDLWIGTMNGLMRYQFKKDKENIPAPLIYITKKHLLFDEKDLQRSKLNYKENYITFDYVGISLSNADKIRYSYRLDGFDNKWSPLLIESRVSYANLPPGKYAFIVKAGYKGGSWSAPASYAFVISPPFYKTWWFILLACAAIYGIVSTLYRYRVDQLLKLEKMRNKIASDLHDDIGSALSSISIFSEVADQQLQQRSPPEHTREVIGYISHQSRAMLEAMDDIVWAVNPKNDHFNDLAVRMREFAIPLLEARNISFDIDINADMQHTRIHMEARKNIFLVFKECINNIIKHSGCTQIKVFVKKLNNQLEFMVSDNGKGFDINQQSNRNGLRNMQKRATEMNGVLQVTTQPGSGTMIKLLVNII